MVVGGGPGLEVESRLEEAEGIDPGDMFVSAGLSVRYSSGAGSSGAYVVQSAIWLSIDLKAAF